MTCAWVGSAIAAVLHRHKKVDKEVPREPGRAFPVFRSRGRYGHFPRVKCSTEAGRFASRCRLGRVSFLRGAREVGHRYSGRYSCITVSREAKGKISKSQTKQIIQERAPRIYWA